VHRQCSPRRSAEKDLLTDITSPGASWPVSLWRCWPGSRLWRCRLLAH